METNLAVFMAISSTAYLCGACVLSGFALNAIYQIYKPDFDTKGAWRTPLLTAAVCVNMASGGLGAMFSFISLVIGVGPERPGFGERMAIFILFFLLGLSFALIVVHLFNVAFRRGRLVMVDLEKSKAATPR